MRSIFALALGASVAGVAFFRSGGFGADALSIGRAALGFLAATASVEAVDLVAYSIDNRRKLERALNGRYGVMVSSAGVIAFVTLLTALSIVFHPVA